MIKHRPVLYLGEDVVTVTIKRELLLIKRDVMPFSIYGTGPITLKICTFPFSPCASTTMMKVAFQLRDLQQITN